MASIESPAGARRRVRLAVRRAREAMGATQTEVAEAMEWSLSKVMRIESGEVTVSQNDLRPLLGYLGIKDRAEVDALITAAKLSKQRQQWWDEPRLRELITPALYQLIQFETAAVSVRYFYSLLIPGRLQTPEYARAVISTYHAELDDKTIEARLEVRQRRREWLNERRGNQKIYALLDESVLYRRVGGNKVLGEQLAALVDLIDDGRLFVRVVTYDSPAPIPWLGGFELLYLDHEVDENAILYRESDLIDEIVEDIDKLRRHREIFDRLWQAVPDEGAARQLLTERANALLHSA